MSIYPNPVDDILNVDLNSSDITITDISGRVHFKSSSAISGNVSLNVAGLAQGIYAIRSGNHSQTFIKNTSSNGQDINILTSSYIASPLIKENNVQSQFDYRFTIYSDGFKPKDYYTRAIEKDTVVELDMSTLTSSFDGNKIKVTLFFKDYITNYKIQVHMDPEIKYIRTDDITESFIDTLVIRNGKINLKKYYKKESDENFEMHKIQFDIDTLNRTISNFKLTKESNERTSNINEFHDETQLSIFGFQKSVSYNSATDFKLVESFNELTATFMSKNEKYSNYHCSGHYTNWDFQSCDRNISYIKIEFID